MERVQTIIFVSSFHQDDHSNTDSHNSIFCSSSPLSELASLEKSLPGKKRGLSEAESELRVVGEAAERLGQQVRACRMQAEEARSTLLSHRSR